MTIKEINEQLQEGAASQDRSGLNRGHSYNMNQQETYGPQLSTLLHEICSTNTPNRSVRPIQCAGEQLGVTHRASTAGDGHPSFDHLANITNLSEVNHPAAPERDYATCACQAVCSVPSIMSQDHLISILEDALGLISEISEENSE